MQISLSEQALRIAADDTKDPQGLPPTYRPRPPVKLWRGCNISGFNSVSMRIVHFAGLWRKCMCSELASMVTSTRLRKMNWTSYSLLFSLFWAELRQELHHDAHWTEKYVCPKTWSNLAPVPVHWEPLQWEEEAWTKTDWTSCPSPSFCVLSDPPIPTCVFVTLGDCSPQLLETKGELLWHDVARSSCGGPCVRHESKFTATCHHFATATVAPLQLFQLFHIDKYEITQLKDLVLHFALSSLSQ